MKDKGELPSTARKRRWDKQSVDEDSKQPKQKKSAWDQETTPSRSKWDDTPSHIKGSETPGATPSTRIWDATPSATPGHATPCNATLIYNCNFIGSYAVILAYRVL